MRSGVRYLALRAWLVLVLDDAPRSVCVLTPEHCTTGHQHHIDKLQCLSIGTCTTFCAVDTAPDKMAV